MNPSGSFVCVFPFNIRFCDLETIKIENYTDRYAAVPRLRICMLYISVTIILLLNLVSCASNAPRKPIFSSTGSTSTVYSGKAVKDENADSLPLPSKDEVAARNADVSPVITDTGDRLAMTPTEEIRVGTLLYMEWCASCHLPVDVSNRRGVDAGKILNDYTRNFPTHKPIPWPNFDQAFMIQAALALPVP